MPLTDYATSPRRLWSNGQPGQVYYPDAAIRQWTRHTVERVRVASIGGRIRFLPLYDIYTGETSEIRQEYRRMLRDETVKAAFQTKIFSVISEPVQVHPADPDSPRDREARDFAVYALKRVKGGTAGVGWSLLSGLLIDGHSIAERVWEPQPLAGSRRWIGKRCWYAIKSKDPHFLQLGIDAYRNVDALRGSGYNAGRVWNPQDFVITSYFSLFEDPAGISDFRAAYRAYWTKDTAINLRALHLEKFTGPYLMGTYSSIDQHDALKEALAEANQGTWCTVPAGAMVEAIDLSAKGTTDFKDAIADCERQILVAILGAHLQVQEGQTSGARGNTEVHKATSELPAWYLTSLLQRGYQQLIDELYAENWHGIEPGEVSIGAVSEAEMKDYLAIDQGLQQLGIKLSRKAMLRRYAREEAEDQEDILAPAQQGQQGPGGAMPFSERWRTFCNEGKNKGLPGPCPEGEGESSGKEPPSGKQPKPNDPVQSYLPAFDAQATAKDAYEANQELKGEGSKFRVIPDGKGNWQARHISDLKDDFGPNWTLTTNPLTGLPDAGDKEYFKELAGLAGDRETRNYLRAFNQPGNEGTPEDALTANEELKASGSKYRLVKSEDYGLWIAKPLGAPDSFGERPRHFKGGPPGPFGEFAERGFTGTITDKLGRVRHYVNGKPVKELEPTEAGRKESAIPEAAPAPSPSAPSQADKAEPATIASAFEKIQRSQGGGRVKVPDLFDAVKEVNPGTTLEGFHQQLLDLERQDLLSIGQVNDPRLEPRYDQMIPDPRGRTRLGYILLRPGAVEALRKLSEEGPPGPFGRGGSSSPAYHRFSEDCGCADCEKRRAFCTEGENKGKPGPCPEGGKEAGSPLAGTVRPQQGTWEKVKGWFGLGSREVSATVAQARLAKLPNVPGSTEYVTPPFKIVDQKPWTEAEFKAGTRKVEPVRMDSLHTDQDYVSKDKVSRLIDALAGGKNPDFGEALVIVRYQGKNYLYEGHHRATALALLGNRQINAVVVDAGGKRSEVERFCQEGENKGKSGNPAC